MNFCKNIAGSLICIGFVFLFGGFSVFAESKGEVNDNAVNIRSEASTSSQILAQANAGFKVNVVSKENDFYRITAEGFESAYIAAAYIDLLFSEGEVSDNRVNLRGQPSTTGEIIAVLDMGKKLQVVGVTDSWYAVDYNGEAAYIHKDFVTGNLLSSIKTVNPSNNAVALQAPKLDVALPTVAVEAPEQTIAENIASVSDGVNAESLVLIAETVAEEPVAQAAPAEQSDSIYAVINSNTGLKLRAGPSTEAEVLMILPYGEVLDVLVLDDTWTNVYFDGTTGYVSSEFITISRGQRPERIVRTLGQQVIDYAKQYLGTPYVYAGNSLTKGVDCSGFVYQVMKNFGVKLTRNSSSQYRDGIPIKKAELQTGDLVFFNTGGGNSISHVGIYIGGGQFIHSSSSKRTWGITISSLNEAYYQRTYVSACRVLS